MEIKLIIALDSSTKEAIENLTKAIAGGEKIKLAETPKAKAIETPKTKVVEAPKVENVPEVKKEIKATIEDVRKVFVEKKRAGFSDEIKKILKSYGVAMVSNLDPKDYDDIIVKVNALGN